MAEAKVRIKKVGAYPIEVEFERAAIKFKGSIQRLEMKGFMVRVDTFMKPGEVMKFVFKFPASEQYLNGDVKVIKTYDQYRIPNPTQDAPPDPAKPSQPIDPKAPPKPPAEQKGVDRLVEMHFLKLTSVQVDQIERFLKAIRQVR